MKEEFGSGILSGGMRRRLVLATVSLAMFLGTLSAQDSSEILDQDAMNAAAEAALSRVAQDVEERGVESREPVRVLPVRRRSTVGTSDPVYRHGVAYHDEWTIRAGALKLRVPAYLGWRGVKANSEFYALQARSGVPGEHLALAITNAQFVRATRSKYVNEFGLIWVPQESAFLSMTGASFSEFKETLRQRIVEDRRKVVDRDDFMEFEDYIDFKQGRDEEVDEFLDGYFFRAMDEPDLVMYFSTSEFVYQTSRQEIRQPMIMTVTYALVRGKLLRFDFRRLFLSDEDAVELVSFTKRFVEDMRTLNGLSERKLR
ncbi:hypothetical protein VDG1235_4542 [Verrucomicrobiia bacterium DG1235]|nr:hypothetical protein VDG1235_4542 [Verrucomicrobiae bacterium DG1235]